MELDQFFHRNPKIAIAFSGGVDSSYLLYCAKSYGAQVKAYYVKTLFQPQFEYEEAKEFAKQINVNFQTIELDILSYPDIASNPCNRCYICKKRMFTAILEAANKDGYPLVLEGSNASDNPDDRPGMLALKELGIRSPLREVGLTKEEIRSLSKDAGLSTYNKPANSCLATRIPTGTALTASNIYRTEQSENFLRSMGFSNFRIRMLGSAAKIQLPANQYDSLLQHRKAVLSELKKYYSNIYLDLEDRNES